MEWEGIALLNDSKVGLELIKMNNDRLPMKGLKEQIDQMKYVKSQRKINTVTSNSGLTISIICMILIIIIFVVIYLFIRTAKNNEDETDDIAARNLLAKYRQKRLERRLKRAERHLETEESTPLEDDGDLGSRVRQDRPFHSSPNSPVPLPRERSNTEVSTLTVPRVSIVTPDACIFDARPDSL